MASEYYAIYSSGKASIIQFSPAAWTVKKMLELILGHQYEIRGTENIDTAHGSVVLINHQSFIDVGGNYIGRVYLEI